MSYYDLNGWEAKENAQKFWAASDMSVREIVSIIDRALKAEEALRVWCIPALEAAQEHAETYEVHRKWVKEVDDALRYARTALEGK
jgi:hypothetical protein